MSSGQNLKEIAEAKYYELLEYFESENKMATALADFMDVDKKTIVRNLQIFSFRKSTSTLEFIKAADMVLNRVKSMKINATVLLLSGANISNLVMVEEARKLIDLGINIIAPGLLMESEHEQYWEYVKADVALVDFIVTCDIDTIEYCLLLDKKDDKEIFDIKSIKDIQTFAIQVTLKKCKFRLK